MGKILMGAILVFSALCFSRSAATADERQASLKDALTIALENNHELRAFTYAVSAQREEIGIARSFLLPKVSFEERFMRTNNPTFAFSMKLNQGRFTQSDFAIDSLNSPDPITDFQTAVSFEQPILVRKAAIGLDISRDEFAAKSEEYLRKREETALRVTQTYLLVHTARAYVTAAAQGVEDAREHLRIAELRYTTGLGLYSDTLRASTALTEAEQRVVTARKNLSVAKRGLGLLLGMAESVDVAGETPEIPVQAVDYYVHEAALRRDIRSLEKRFESAKRGVTMAESGYLPVITVGGAYQLNDHRRPFGSEGDSWNLVAFLRWDAFDGTKREHEKTKAKHKVAETEEYLNGLRKAVGFKVYEAYLGVEEAKMNAELSRAALRTAEEGKRLVQRRYEGSLSPFVDLLDAQTSLDHARSNLVARENEYRLAVCVLGYESGTILKDLKMEEIQE
jgi:outer membrane protein TolC